jgi:predicted transcriptional regulator
MFDNDETPSGGQLRLEYLRELKKLWEWRPGPANYFDGQHVWDSIRDRHQGVNSKELAETAEVAVNSLLQEELARAYQNSEGNLGFQITTKGLDYLAQMEAQDKKTPGTPGGKIIIIGPVTGSIVNIDSMLEQVTQNIGTASHVDEAAKKQLTELIEQLKTELQKAPPTKKEEAEALAEAAKALVEAGTKDQPNKTTVQITAEGLKKAAENIAGVMPTVLSIASSIVKTVFQFAGIPLP